MLPALFLLSLNVNMKLSIACQCKDYPASWYWIWYPYSRFIVKKGAPGLKATKIENKIGLIMVKNGDVVLNKVFVPDEDRLPGINSFRDINKVLDTSFTTSSATCFVGWRFLFGWTFNFCNRCLPCLAFWCHGSQSAYQWEFLTCVIGVCHITTSVSSLFDQIRVRLPLSHNLSWLGIWKKGSNLELHWQLFSSTKKSLPGCSATFRPWFSLAGDCASSTSQAKWYQAIVV